MDLLALFGWFALSTNSPNFVIGSVSYLRFMSYDSIFKNYFNIFIIEINLFSKVFELFSKQRYSLIKYF